MRPRAASVCGLNLLVSAGAMSRKELNIHATNQTSMLRSKDLLVYAGAKRRKELLELAEAL